MQAIRKVQTAYVNKTKSTALGEGRMIYDYEYSYVDFSDPDIRLLIPDTITDYGLVASDDEQRKVPTTQINYRISPSIVIAENIDEVSQWWKEGKEYHEKLITGRFGLWTDDRIIDFLMNTPGINISFSFETLQHKIAKFRKDNYNV